MSLAHEYTSIVIEIGEIEAFLAVADELHFAKAAERLLVSPSRVSQLIRQLESRRALNKGVWGLAFCGGSAGVLAGRGGSWLAVPGVPAAGLVPGGPRGGSRPGWWRAGCGRGLVRPGPRSRRGG